MNEVTEDSQEANPMEYKQGILIGVNELIDARWTIVFEFVPTDFLVKRPEVHILFYGRNCYSGYTKEYPEAYFIEDDKRVARKLHYDGEEYIINNPKFVFSYGSSNN